MAASFREQSLGLRISSRSQHRTRCSPALVLHSCPHSSHCLVPLWTATTEVTSVRIDDSKHRFRWRVRQRYSSSRQRGCSCQMLRTCNNAPLPCYKRSYWHSPARLLHTSLVCWSPYARHQFASWARANDDAPVATSRNTAIAAPLRRMEVFIDGLTCIS